MADSSSNRPVSDLSGKGDVTQRDVTLRTLTSVGAATTTTEAYVDIDNVKQKVTHIESSAPNGNGRFSIFVRNFTTSNVETNPRVEVTPNVTTLASDVTAVKGALTVTNYASFEEDVDITTGSVTVGRNLIVDGLTYHGDNVHVTNASNANTTVVLSDTALTFSSKWRIVYDEPNNAIAFEQNTTESVEAPQWQRRFLFSQP